MVVTQFSPHARITEKGSKNLSPPAPFYLFIYLFKLSRDQLACTNSIRLGQESFHSGSASCDDCGRTFPSEVRVNSFPSLYLQVIHFTSHHTTSHVFFLACLYSAGTQHGNLHSAGWHILFCGPTQEPCVSHSQHRRNWERFWKNAGEWTGRVEISKEEIPGSKRSIYGCILTYCRL